MFAEFKNHILDQRRIWPTVVTVIWEKDHTFQVLALWDLNQISTEAAIQWCFVKEMLLKVLHNLQEKNCQSLFFNKVAGWRPKTLLKKRTRHGCFPVNVAKLLRAPITRNTAGRLFSEILIAFVV